MSMNKLKLKYYFFMDIKKMRIKKLESVKK